MALRKAALIHHMGLEVHAPPPNEAMHWCEPDLYETTCDAFRLNQATGSHPDLLTHVLIPLWDLQSTAWRACWCQANKMS